MKNKFHLKRKIKAIWNKSSEPLRKIIVKDSLQEGYDHFLIEGLTKYNLSYFLR